MTQKAHRLYCLLLREVDDDIRILVIDQSWSRIDSHVLRYLRAWTLNDSLEFQILRPNNEILNNVTGVLVSLLAPEIHDDE